jgi:hypothetical protein
MRERVANVGRVDVDERFGGCIDVLSMRADATSGPSTPPVVRVPTSDRSLRGHAGDSTPRELSSFEGGSIKPEEHCTIDAHFGGEGRGDTLTMRRTR